MQSYTWTSHSKSGCGEQYMVFAASLLDAQQTMRLHYKETEALEALLKYPPKIRSVPEVLCFFDPNTILRFQEDRP